MNDAAFEPGRQSAASAGGDGGMSDEILRLYLSLDEKSRQKADAFVHQLLEQNRRAAG